MRRLSAVLAAGLLSGLLVTPAAAAPFPDTIALPNGFAPEGIAIGGGHTFYAGSLTGAGVVRGDLRTGAVAPLAPGDGRTFVGLALDTRGRLWAAGGPDGAGYVIDAATGATLATFAFTGGPSFVNDVVVTRGAAWFTDSFNPVLYRVAIAPNGAIGAVDEIDLSGAIDFIPNDFNLNGIDATSDGATLVVVSSAAQTLFTIDVASLTVDAIDLGGPLPNGDGILLHGRTLYVVQNFLNRIAVVELSADLASGSVAGTIGSGAFDIPTTVARFGSALYVVNARFTTPMAPTTEYWAVRVSAR